MLYRDAAGLAEQLLPVAGAYDRGIDPAQHRVDPVQPGDALLLKLACGDVHVGAEDAQRVAVGGSFDHFPAAQYPLPFAAFGHDPVLGVEAAATAADRVPRQVEQHLPVVGMGQLDQFRNRRHRRARLVSEQLRPVLAQVQAPRQYVVVPQRDAGSLEREIQALLRPEYFRLVLAFLDRDAGDVGGRRHQLQFRRVGRARGPEIVGEGAEHVAVPGEYGRGPAGAKAVRGRNGAVIRP